jgi:hypothetical protein
MGLRNEWLALALTQYAQDVSRRFADRPSQRRNRADVNPNGHRIIQHWHFFRCSDRRSQSKPEDRAQAG